MAANKTSKLASATRHSAACDHEDGAGRSRLALHFIINGTVRVRSNSVAVRDSTQKCLCKGRAIKSSAFPGPNPVGPPPRVRSSSAFRSITSIRAPVQPELVLISEFHIFSYYRATPHPLHFPSYGNQQLSG